MNRKPAEGLPHLMSNAAEQIVRNSAALRHAQAALERGKVAEALIVLDAAANGIHLSWTELKILVKAKEAELLEAANMADEVSLAAAYEKYHVELADSRPVDKRKTA